MFSKALFTSAILALSSTVVQAQTDDEKAKYSDWTGALNLYRYDWKPYEVKTEDGYTLTIMNVTKKHSNWRIKADLNPVIVQGALGLQADKLVEMYMQQAPADYPVPFKLLDEGHDLWYIYNRGGTYSQKHDSMSVYDADFWNFNFEQIGQYDVKAAMDFVYTKTGKKTALYSIDTGTSAVLAGLTTDYEWFKERTYKVALLAPCTVQAASATVGIDATTVTLSKAQGIFELGGPTWYKTAGKINKVVGVQAMKSIIGITAFVKGMPYQQFDTLAQQTKMNRFQRWSDTFWATPEGLETELYDLSAIKDIPVAMLMAKNNLNCPMAQNEITKQQIGAMVQMYSTYETDQLYTYNGKDMNDDLVNFLSDKFTPNAVPSMFLQ